ncbi:hypothetical protein ACFV3E_05940 [Streptomyces sp. NPDC059718]
MTDDDKTEKLPPPEPTLIQPEVHVHFVQPTVQLPEPAESRWNFAWLQPTRNAKCMALAVVTAPWWAAALRDLHQDQSIEGAWVMAGAAFVATYWLDRRRGAWWTRVLVWTATFGAFGALPVFSTLVRIMTGSPA